ncbi:MAG: zinc ribbon domain-containing protein [Candidatus Latescibacterota bacterium]|nr:zinc ribbon domain-containing protein [Candidatus Latescibacterota bacterium]
MPSVLIPSACLALLGVFLVAVGHPILTHRHAWRRATGARRRRLELTERKEQLYASIKELEFDHSLGKISPQDYDAVRGGLEVQAVDVLRNLDGLEVGGGDLDDRIEADITSHRRPDSSTAQPAARTAEPHAHAFCHKCGEQRTPEFRFCPYCGQSFAATAP